MLDGVIVPVQQMAYSILYFAAETLWGINQALLLVGYYILSITSWLSQQMFQPLLASIGNATDSLLLPVFTLAMIILAITYLLGVFGVFRVVEFKSAFVWMLVAVMWFQFGPELYLGFEQFRRELSGGFYGTTFTDLVDGGGSVEGMNQIGDAGDMQIDPPINNFGAYLTYDTAIDGLDIAMAYLDADACDVLRTAGCLFQPIPDGSNGSMPLDWYRAGGYFYIDQHSFFYQFGMTQEERQSSLDDAARGIWAGLSGIVISLFGMVEQIVNLLLTIAFGIAFASFFIAILFAFFKKTESVTWAVFDIILGLFIQSIITSLLLALVMAFVSVAGATGNGILLLGVGFLGIILITILLIGAVQAILKALNGLMGSFGQATGGNLGAAGTVSKVVGAYATGGATLAAGGSLVQAAGATLGPKGAQQAYYASRAFGGENTTLGRVANEFAQGASAAYAGPIGGAALGYSNRQQERESVQNLTLGTPIRTNDANGQSRQSITPEQYPNLAQRAAEGESLRTDPLTQEPYAFRQQDNGQGVRTFEDGSRLYTDHEDVPQDRERAREERRASHQAGEISDISDAAVARIDASDDDENADILAAIRTGNQSQTGEASQREPATTLINHSDDASGRADQTETLNGQAITPTESFLLDIELAHPGVTSREDLVSRYYPDGLPAQQPATQVIDIQADNVSVDVAAEDVIQVPQVGEATQNRLADAGITTAGQLANASSEQLTDVGISERRADFLIGQAQTYVGEVPAQADEQNDVLQQTSLSASGNDPDADQIAAASDAVNNDDAVRLANGVGAAVRTALSSGVTPTSVQASQIATRAGLPEVPQAGQFVQVASAMGLNQQQAQTIIQDVQNNNAIGAEIGQSIRASLSTLTLSNGSQLGHTGMEQAVSLLEGAARSLVSAANTMNTSTGTTDGDAATVGSNTPPTSSGR